MNPVTGVSNCITLAFRMSRSLYPEERFATGLSQLMNWVIEGVFTTYSFSVITGRNVRVHTIDMRCSALKAAFHRPISRIFCVETFLEEIHYITVIKFHFPMGNLLYFVAAILIIAWFVGFVGYSSGGLIHILLVIAVIAIVFKVIQEQRIV